MAVSRRRAAFYFSTSTTPSAEVRCRRKIIIFVSGLTIQTCKLDDIKDIFSRMAGGDRSAFREIFILFYPKVRTFVSRLIPDSDEAKDVAQSIFIRIWLNRERFTEVKNFDAYIFTLSKHTVLNHLDKARRKQGRQEDGTGEIYDLALPSDKLEMLDMKRRIDNAVEEMPPQRKQVFTMSRILGMKNGEIADRLNLSKKTVENHINLALKEIRKKFPVLFLLIFIGAQEILIVFKI